MECMMAVDKNERRREENDDDDVCVFYKDDEDRFRQRFVFKIIIRLRGP